MPNEESRGGDRTVTEARTLVMEWAKGNQELECAAVRLSDEGAVTLAELLRSLPSKHARQLYLPAFKAAIAKLDSKEFESIRSGAPESRSSSSPICSLPSRSFDPFGRR